MMSTEDVYYDSYKEERDLVLEYNQVTLDDVKMVNLMGVGVESLTRAQAVVKVMKMIESGGIHHVISLNPYKILRIRSNSDLGLIVGKADLRLASGAGLCWASRMIKNPLKEKVHFISFLMDLVRIAEIKDYTIFLVGGKPEIAEKAFLNIKKSFPDVRIVGRHGGYFTPEREKSVVEAIRKSQANIVLVGLGFPKEEKWIYKIKNEFKDVVFISVGGSIDIISGDIKKAPAFFMERGLDWFYRIITRPWRIGRLLRLVYFYVYFIVKRIFV